MKQLKNLLMFFVVSLSLNSCAYRTIKPFTFQSEWFDRLSPDGKRLITPAGDILVCLKRNGVEEFNKILIECGSK